MAYKITLNLGGTATRKVSKLANDLERANVAAGLLAGNLGKVATASRSVGHIRSYGGGSRGMRSDTQTGYSRHKYTRIGSYGVGGSIGPFSGRLSTIIQPDVNGNILGMNAERLMRGANIAALATSIMKSVGKVLLKTVAAATVSPMLIGGGVVMGAMRALQSEGFAGGVRLISRRRQAKLGLGAEYERGQSNADFLSQAYGFDRATTLSSINVLSGMGIGGTDRVLNTREATGLTKVGGLIAQQSGVAFERVMTNIQQLLVQTTPHIRDIREMLNQAPILGKYAMKDMKEQGVKGVDVRTWFKDSANIMSALKRYEIDLASNAGMRARGQISLAQQDSWERVAGNDKVWEYFGFAGAKLINTFADSINNLLSAFTSNKSFLVMVERLNVGLEAAGKNGGSFLDNVLDKFENFAQKWGVPMGDQTIAFNRVNKQAAIEGLLSQPDIKKQIIDYAKSSKYFKDVPLSAVPDMEKLLLMEVFQEARTDKPLLQNIKGRGTQFKHAAAWDYLPDVAQSNWSIANWSTLPAYPSSVYRYGTGYGNKPSGLGRSDVRPFANPEAKYPALDVSIPDFLRVATEYIDRVTGAGTIPTDVKGGVDGGKDLTGFNQDRRALEIHFNAPIVEWTNTMQTSSPQETVEAVKDNIEMIASAAIQKALLGASNKMSSRWY